MKRIALLSAALLTLAACDLGGLFGGGGSSSSSGGAASGEGSEGGGAETPLTPGMRFTAEEGHRLIDLGSQAGRPTPPDEVLARAQCADMTEGGPVDSHGITGEIGCGESIVGHTRGGVAAFDTRFYEKHFCTPATTNHSGGDERIYRLHVPDGRWRAWVYLDTPCADLDLAVIKWSGSNLPTEGSTVADCEMFPKDGRRREIVDVTSDRESDWLIAVEGKDEEEGAFGLTVLCVPW